MRIVPVPCLSDNYAYLLVCPETKEAAIVDPSEPEPVRVHDFVDKELGRATPYGGYDLARNQGWVTVGIDHDTAEFAVASAGASTRVTWSAAS